MRAHFKFNGIKSSNRNIVLKGYKPIFLPALNAEYEQVPGRHGSVEFNDNTRQDVVIEADIAILGGSKQEVMANARAAEYWLSQKGQLNFWDEPQRFYIGRIVNQIPLERTAAWGDVTLLFRCEPFAYFIKSMAEEIILDDEIPICEQITLDRATAVHQITGPTTIEVENNGAFELEPFIKIEGSFDNLAIGGLVINKALASDILYIDNELGEIYTKQLETRVNWMPYSSGGFLSLKHGINDVQISGNNMNFTLSYLSRERW